MNDDEPIGKGSTTLDYLRARHEWLGVMIDEAAAELAAARERVRVLTDLLRPFAAIEVREDGPPAPSDGWMATWCNIDTFPTVADVLAARAALAQTPAGGATSE